MLKRYIDLKPHILSIVSEHNALIKNRLQEDEFQPIKNANPYIQVDDSDIYDHNLTDVLRGIIKSVNIESGCESYENDIENLKKFLEKAEKVQAEVEQKNEVLSIKRKSLIDSIKNTALIKTKALTGDKDIYQVKIRTSKLSEPQVEAIEALIEKEGFEEIDGNATTWRFFNILFKGDEEDVKKFITSIIPETNLRFMDSKICVLSNDIFYIFQE